MGSSRGSAKRTEPDSSGAMKRASSSHRARRFAEAVSRAQNLAGPIHRNGKLSVRRAEAMTEASQTPPTATETCARCEKTLSFDDRMATRDRVFCRSCYQTLVFELKQ